MNKDLNKKKGKEEPKFSRGLSSLKDYVADIAQEDLKKEKEKDKLEFSKKSVIETDKLTKEPSSFNSDDDNWNNFLYQIKEYKEEADGRVLVYIRNSAKDLLYDLKSIAELREYGITDILSASLKLFIEQNKDILNKKLNERRTSF